MHCLNIVRCMIVYLDCINIMRFQKENYYLFFLNALPISGINSSNLNESIQLLNATIYTYFEENFGYSDEVYNEELINKYKDMPKRSLKTNLKFLKQTQASPLEIKYVSRLLRNKLRNTTGKPTSEIDHNEQIKKNFWGYVKANLKNSSSLSPSFDTETCRTFFQDFFRSQQFFKIFHNPRLDTFSLSTCSSIQSFSTFLSTNN